MKKYGDTKNPFEDLRHEDKLKSGGAAIFGEYYEVKKAKKQEPIIVCGMDETIKVSEDEADLLSLGPKFCVFNDLNEETFEREVEESIIKLKWEFMGEELKKKEEMKFGEEALEAINLLFDEDELEAQNEEDRIEEAKSRMTFDGETKSMNMGR